uniref:Chloride channel protein n=1 Tax=Pyrodinium bahamense TaxID=73915 RepID=A0A7R9ZWB3_9DINO
MAASCCGGPGNERRPRAFHYFRRQNRQAHALSSHLMWAITMLTAVGMAVANFVTVWIISCIVEKKFDMMQKAIETKGVTYGILTIVAVVSSLAAVCACLVAKVKGAGGSGAPENKGWLNGNTIPGLFTWENLFGRAAATILANTAGYPVGREGPTVTMGSNLAFLITQKVQEWVNVESSPAELPFDEERFSHAKRIICTVGGACGMAMLFDSPIGGIVYMFEEITAASWPLELTFRAFAGTIVCTLVSRALLDVSGTNVKTFVVYEWHPMAKAWSWNDMPFFILIGVLMGPFSAFHTRACLFVAAQRQKAMGYLARYQPWAKMADAILYATIVVSTYALTALMGSCLAKAEEQTGLEFVRFNCKEKEYNPVASLLLTTTDASVKRLFSTTNIGQLHWRSELYAFLAYTALNIGLTGVPVPSGNFTGSMLIGGLAGRMVGCTVHQNGLGGLAVTGVYAMVGSAAMLCGFKQMSVAVVIFISGCAGALSLVPPLMCSVTVSLFLNQCINERGFDEEQIMRKKIPFLLPEPPKAMDGVPAKFLCDSIPPEAVLPPKASLEVVTKALEAPASVVDFPVVKASGFCIGFTTRERLDAALKAMQADPPEADASPVSSLPRTGSSPGTPLVGRWAKTCLAAAKIGKETGWTKDLPVDSLADRPHVVLEDMPTPQFYPLFAQAGVRIACVAKENGVFHGMISRTGLINACRKAEEEGHHPRQDDEDGPNLSDNSEEDEACKSGYEEDGFMEEGKGDKQFGPL